MKFKKAAKRRPLSSAGATDASVASKLGNVLTAIVVKSMTLMLIQTALLKKL